MQSCAVTLSGCLSGLHVRLSCGRSWVRVLAGPYQRPQLIGTNCLPVWQTGIRVGFGSAALVVCEIVYGAMHFKDLL